MNLSSLMLDGLACAMVEIKCQQLQRIIQSCSFALKWMQFTIKLIVLSLITQRPPITCPYLYPYMDVKDTQECTTVYIVNLHYSLDMLDSREVKSSNMQTHVQGSKSNTHGKLLEWDLLHRTSIQRNANMYTHTQRDNHRNNHTSPFVNAIHTQLWPTTDNLHTWGRKRVIFKLERVISQLSEHSCSKNNSAQIALI